jgi:hypothetical protein
VAEGPRFAEPIDSTPTALRPITQHLRSYPGCCHGSCLLYPNGVASPTAPSATEPPLGYGMDAPPRPRVAAARQPWAMRRNRFAVIRTATRVMGNVGQRRVHVVASLRDAKPGLGETGPREAQETVEAVPHGERPLVCLTHGLRRPPRASEHDGDVAQVSGRFGERESRMFRMQPKPATKAVGSMQGVPPTLGQIATMSTLAFPVRHARASQGFVR